MCISFLNGSELSFAFFDLDVFPINKYSNKSDECGDDGRESASVLANGDKVDTPKNRGQSNDECKQLPTVFSCVASIMRLSSSLCLCDDCRSAIARISSAHPMKTSS